MILLIVSFIAGVLTVLAPCILPLLPVVLGGAVAGSTDRKRPLRIIASLSISVFIFTLALKGSTALINVSPSFWSYVSATILVLFGLSLVFPEAWARIVLTIPGHDRPDSWLSKNALGVHSPWSDILVGAALGPVFTTCSPTFFVILATVLPQSLAMGIIDLVAYIVGLGLILLLIAHLGQRLVSGLEWAANPNGWFRRTLGALFIILAVCIVFGWDKQFESYILRSGFFDVTTLEQNIHIYLEGKGQKLEQSPSTSTTASNSSSDHIPSSTSLPPSSSANKSSTLLPAPPIEHNQGKFVEIKDPAGFVNSSPFKLADIIGKKVIVIDFIDYSCINCERTFPFLNDWYSKYKDQGLEIVAIHTPEFSFEKEIGNVEAAAKQFGLKFPIVLDNNYSTWNAYGNQYWPHKYFIDIHGNVVYDHIGEGNDKVLEAEIVKLLNDRKKFLGESGTVSVNSPTMPDYSVRAASPETYFGAMRNEFFANGNPGITTTSTFVVPTNLSDNAFYLGGDWHIDNEYATNEAASASISYIFNAGGVYLVAASADGSPVQAKVLIDGKPIAADISGSDVVNGILTIKDSRLYRLYDSKIPGRHRLDIIFLKKEARVFTFTFG